MRYFIYMLALSLPLAGCALFGFGGGDPVLPKAKGYDVSAPADWKMTDKAESDRAYRLQSGNLVTVTSSCTAKNDGVAPDILTRHLLFGARNIVIDKKEELTIQDSAGLFSSVRATLDGEPIYLQLFVLPKGGCVFDFGLIGPRALSDKDTQDFRSFIKSFRYGKS